jgi:hypothetical protein
LAEVGIPQLPVIWIVLAAPAWSAGAFAGNRVSKTRHSVIVKNAFGGGVLALTLGAACRRLTDAVACAVLPPACPAGATTSWAVLEPAAALAGAAAKAAAAAEAKRTQACR